MQEVEKGRVRAAHVRSVAAGENTEVGELQTRWAGCAGPSEALVHFVAEVPVVRAERGQRLVAERQGREVQGVIARRHRLVELGEHGGVGC